MRKSAVLSLIFLLAFFSAAYAEWNQYQRDSKHHAYTDEQFETSIPLCIKWRHQIWAWKGAVPLIDNNGIAYIHGRAGLMAIDIKTGEALWSNGHNNRADTAAVLYKDKIIALTYDGGSGFTAFNTKDGSIAWKSIPAGLPYNSFLPDGYTYGNGMRATLAGDYIYAGTKEGYLIKVSAIDGSLVWLKNPTNTKCTYNGAPAVDDDGSVYAGNSARRLVALRPDGSVKWARDMGVGIYSSVTIDNDNIYFGGLNSMVYALNKVTGALKWSYRTGSFIAGGGALKDGIYYVGSDDRHVYAIRTSDGTLKWKTQPLVDNFASMGCIVVGRLVIINGCAFNNYYIDIEDGAVERVCSSTQENFTTPAFGFGTYIYTSMDGYIYGIAPCPPECDVCECKATLLPTLTVVSSSTKTLTPTKTHTPTHTWTDTYTGTPTNTFTHTNTATFTETFTDTNTPTFTATFTDTNTATFTPTFTPTFTDTNTSTLTPTNTSTATFTATLTFTNTFTHTPTATNTSTPDPCVKEPPPDFKVKMIFNPEHTDDIIFEIDSTLELAEPPLVTIYPHGATDNKDILTFTAVLIPGETKKYRVLYPKQTGFGDIDKVVVKGTSICGKTGQSSGDFDKSVISEKDVKIIDNVIEPDKGERSTITWKVYEGGEAYVKIYNRNGSLLKVLFEGVMTKEGTYSTMWDGTDANGRKVSSGTYIVVVKTPYYEAKDKISVLR
ncbi:MAG: hypothetical protein CVV21_03385 [Candidatus Goldiibacteriota bacterium HGW-Goldbacteria-1]|jgi:outer membrane protein assembly factor BamB|nr:MAG: hypothetical protein CVV21_03385 [Candidatus Goldiibacteriota bacterium HGW-Goldbacteria-1]